MKKTLIPVFLAFVFPLLGTPLEEIDQYIESMRQKTKVPGVAVAIVQENQVLLSKGYGLAHAAHKEKIDADTIFQLASVSKTFTAAALGIQVECKQLGWDEEIILHLPRFALKDPYPTRYATCRDLLAHRTGLPAFGGDLLGKLGYSPQEILERVRLIEPASSFRDKAYYSNVGFFIAGELLAKVAGKRVEKVIRTTLLEPLKMNRSGFSENLKRGNVASAHAEIEGKVQPIPWDAARGFPAAGGMTSTANDMSRWMRMLLNGGKFEERQILQPQTLTEMFLPSMVSELSFTELPPIGEESGFSYALGWNNYHYQGKMVVEKGGGLDGVRTLVTLIPSQKIGITILSNLNMTVLPELIRAKFLELFVGASDNDLEKGILEKGKVFAQLLENPPLPQPVLPLLRPLSAYMGTFESPLYGLFAITQEEDHLHISAGPAEWPGTLTHWSDDTFLLRWPTINSGHQLVTFQFGPEGTPLLLTTETLGSFSPKK